MTEPGATPFLPHGIPNEPEQVISKGTQHAQLASWLARTNEPRLRRSRTNPRPAECLGLGAH